MMGAPYCGYSSIRTVGACWYDGAKRNEKRWSMMARASLVCKTARFCPTQVRTPRPNGMNPTGCFAARATPSENLAGLKSFASLPQIAWSWWTARIGISNSVPRGILYPPNSTSALARLIVAIIGGYNRRDSFSIMLSCTPDINLFINNIIFLNINIKPKTKNQKKEKNGSTNVKIKAGGVGRFLLFQVCLCLCCSNNNNYTNYYYYYLCKTKRTKSKETKMGGGFVFTQESRGERVGFS